MSTPEYIKTVTRQCEFLNRLIQEAQATEDRDQAVLLFGMARDETDNLSKSLRQHLARVLPGHELNAA